MFLQKISRLGLFLLLGVSVACNAAVPSTPTPQPTGTPDTCKEETYSITLLASSLVVPTGSTVTLRTDSALGNSQYNLFAQDEGAAEPQSILVVEGTMDKNPTAGSLNFEPLSGGENPKMEVVLHAVHPGKTTFFVNVNGEVSLPYHGNDGYCHQDFEYINVETQRIVIEATGIALATPTPTKTITINPTPTRTLTPTPRPTPICTTVFPKPRITLTAPVSTLRVGANITLEIKTTNLTNPTIYLDGNESPNPHFVRLYSVTTQPNNPTENLSSTATFQVESARRASDTVYITLRALKASKTGLRAVASGEVVLVQCQGGTGAYSQVSITSKVIAISAINP